jgi:hypothetical protein
MRLPFTLPPLEVFRLLIFSWIVSAIRTDIVSASCSLDVLLTVRTGPFPVAVVENEVADGCTLDGAAAAPSWLTDAHCCTIMVQQQQHEP